jgi:hypothetical protein
MKNPNSLEMGDMAITHKGGTKGYWVRGVSPDVLNFAKGVLIGGMVLISLWLVFS